MTAPRGRQARLRAEHAHLYPGIDAVWMPVETLIHRVVTLLYGDPAKSGVITGERLLREDHFEFRGSSSRPSGWPSTLSRMSDAAAKPRSGGGTGYPGGRVSDGGTAGGGTGGGGDAGGAGGGGGGGGGSAA